MTTNEKKNQIRGQEKKLKGVELDVKRFHVPGIEVDSFCPNCGSKHTADLSSDYLSFPVIGEPESVHFLLRCRTQSGEVL